MDIMRETTKTRGLIDAFKAAYQSGAGDVELRDAAREILARIDREIKGVQGNSILTGAMIHGRKAFENFVLGVCRKRHAPELEKFYFEHMRTHH